MNNTDFTRPDGAVQKFEVLLALSDVYNSMYIINLSKDSIFEYSASEEMRNVITDLSHANTQIKDLVNKITIPEYRDTVLEFMDLTTIGERMKNKKLINKQFISSAYGWVHAEFVAIDTDESGYPDRILFTTRIIDEEKRREERLIKLSTTDEMTRLGNRRAYEETLASYSDATIPSDLVIIALDVNGLKGVNDNLGHVAGDELIRGAADCIRNGFSKYGDIFRTGGDEFVAVLRTDEDINKIVDEFNILVSGWSGKLVPSMRISVGSCCSFEYPEMSFTELAKEADDRMYQAKEKYYRETGLERRKSPSPTANDNRGLFPLVKSVLNQDRAAVVVCNLDHTIVYMNPAACDNYSKYGGGDLLGKSLLNCHNPRSVEIIHKVVEWFEKSVNHNMIYTFKNTKENKDVYMVALRDDSGKLIGYYEKHEYRNAETANLYDFDNPIK